MPRTICESLTLRLFATAVLLVVGCGKQSETPSDSAPTPPAAPASSASPPPIKIRETYETYYWQGSPIGTVQTVYYLDYYRDGTEFRPTRRITSTGTLTFLRFGQKIEQQIRDTTWMKAGEVTRFESFLLAGSTPQMVNGTVSGTEATLTLRTAGKTTTEKIAWPPGTGCSTKAVDTLRGQPLKVGETRTLTAFMPILNRVATITLTAGGREKVDLAGTPRELIRIDSQTAIAGQPSIDSILWCDERGEVWKTEFPALGQVAVRNASGAAEKTPSPVTPTVDLGTGTMVRISPPLADAHHTQFVRYRVRLTGGDAAENFPNSTSQVVKTRLDNGTTEIDVTAVRPTTPLPTNYVPTPPTEADRRPNALVQSDDAAVQKLAAAAGGDDADPWDVAVRCEKLVREKLRSVEFSTAFATAAETARTLTGDCTEHAVLLCALLRARGIPARATIGLVYVERSDALGYHMWTEAWIGERWIPLDATLGRGGISAGYLKIADSNLAGVDSFAAFLPVFPLLGRLQIEVLERR